MSEGGMPYQDILSVAVLFSESFALLTFLAPLDRHRPQRHTPLTEFRTGALLSPLHGYDSHFEIQMSGSERVTWRQESGSAKRGQW